MKRLLTTICGLLGALTLVAQNIYYVSPDGKDTNKGTVSSPLRTIEEARQRARRTHGETTIYLRQGIYRRDTPLEFTPQDGGEGRALTLRSYPGEKAVLSGCMELKPKWRRHRDGIMKAVLSPAPETMDMLIVNGEIRHMARFPNYDSTAVRFYGTSADATSPRRVKTWSHPEGGLLHAMHISDWGDFHYRITEADKEGNLRLEGGWQNNRRSGLHPDNRMVENILEELDAPGEWFYEAASHTLYYYPVPGEDPEKTLFETPRTECLVALRGSEQEPVRHVTLQDMEFTGTLRTFMRPEYEPLLRSDWTVYRGGAIFLEGTENCSLRDSYLHNLGGNAVFISRYNRRATVSGSHITRIGASAVCFVGDTSAVRSPSFEYGEYVEADALDRTPGPKNNNYPAHCLVHDNLIHRIGLFEKQITGVELSMCQYVTVSHNSIYDTPRAGINVSEGTWGGHVIEFNDVFDTVKETGDHGSFNSWGRDRFWHPDRARMNALVAGEPGLILLDVTAPVTLRNNRFRCDRGWDIDLDDGSSNYLIYNNLCLNGGIKLREGFYRVVENNIMVNNSFHPHVWFAHSGDVFARNLVMTPYRPIQVNDWGTEVDYNIFTDSASLRQAQSRGTDAHSIVCTPVFRNAEQGDYRVVDTSAEIFRCGFRNFDMDRFGVLSPRLRAMAAEPRMPRPIAGGSAGRDTTILWMGLRVKNLDTLGERSATGMDTERGVYVISQEDKASAWAEALRPNDVILSLDGRAVNNVDDLRRASSGLKSGNACELVVFRGQKEQKIAVKD